MTTRRIMIVTAWIAVVLGLARYIAMALPRFNHGTPRYGDLVAMMALVGIIMVTLEVMTDIPSCDFADSFIIGCFSMIIAGMVVTAVLLLC